jgi:uncharacterized protein
MNLPSDEVRWRIGETTVEGALVRPPGQGPFPAVIMVAGSGPTDRDWNSPLLPGTNGSARLLAQALAEAGFASLRYDKRGTGPHAQENVGHIAGAVRMHSFVEEFAAAVGLLAERTDIRTDQVFGLGNSEGTLHVLHYQCEHPKRGLAGLVLTGPPGRSVGAVARSQLAAQAASVPGGDALMSLYDAAIARFLAGEPMNPDAALPEGVQTLLRSLEAPANLPFARELWMADASSLLRAVVVPVLVVIGKKDIQVDWQADGQPIRSAIEGRPQMTAAFPENANHVLKHEPQDRSDLAAGEVMARYNAADARLDPETVETIVAWLRSRIG